MILITGGSGFIGSNLVGALSENGERVSICDTLGTGKKWLNVSKHEIDEIVAPESLNEILTRRRDEISFVYHMGAVTATSETDVDLILASNLRLSQQIWHWCSQYQVPLVYASSAATYGDGRQGFSDIEDRDYMETLRPTNPYGWSKHLFDRWVVRQADEGRRQPPFWAGLKFFNVYGPNEYHKEDMRSAVTKAYRDAAANQPVTLFRSHHPEYKDGEQKRDFIYVKDCVDVILWLSEQTPASGIYNVGTGRAQTWLEMMSALYASVDRTPNIRWVDTPPAIRDGYQYFTEADITKLRSAGYTEPFTSVDEGVSDYVRNFLSRKDPYR